MFRHPTSVATLSPCNRRPLTLDLSNQVRGRETPFPLLIGCPTGLCIYLVQALSSYATAGPEKPVEHIPMLHNAGAQQLPDILDDMQPPPNFPDDIDDDG
jgi:hypothetical protein